MEIIVISDVRLEENFKDKEFIYLDNVPRLQLQYVEDYSNIDHEFEN